MATTINSILAADCGSATTNVVLIERSGDVYYLKAAGQAASTHRPPWEDITLGVQEAARHIEKTVGRPLLSPGGWPITPQNNRQGVDVFVVVSSAAAPVRLMLVGLTQDISLASARKAVSTTYSHLTGLIALDAPPHSPEVRLQTIEQSRPEVILLVGGADKGASEPMLELAQTIAMALHLLPENPPSLIYAGNSDLRPHIADILGPATALKSVNNIRPTLEIEDLSAVQHELETFYLEKKVWPTPGYDKLKNWTPHPLLPASKSFERLIAYVGRHQQQNVLGVDVGSRSSVLVSHYQQKVHALTRSDIGLGYSLAWLLKLVPLENLRRWLPFELSPAELHDYLLNKSLYPTTIPTSPEDLMIEHALAREALRLLVGQLRDESAERQWHLIVGAGRTLTGAPQVGQAALALMDGLEPWGVVNLVVDRNSVTTLLGAIAAVEPLAAAQVAQREAFLPLGTLVAPFGQGRPGQTTLKIKIIPADQAAVEERDIPYGAIEVIPLAAGHKATLEIRPARHFDIGLGQPGRGATTEVEGGGLGLIIDARGRPLKLAQDEAERLEDNQHWLAALNVIATNFH